MARNREISESHIGRRGRSTNRIRLVLWAAYFAVPITTFAQKPIDITAFDTWMTVANTSAPAVSNDGKYISYSILHTRAGARVTTAVLQTLQGDWKLELPGVENTVFTGDSRKVLFLKGKDSLAVLSLGSSAAEYLFPVGAFRLFTQGASEWLEYQATTPDKRLVLRNLATGRQHSFSGVADYVVSEDGSTVVLLTQSANDSAAAQAVSRVRLPEGQQRTIWEGMAARKIVLDASGAHVAFSVEGTGKGNIGNAIWYYREGSGRAVLLADDKSTGVGPELQVADPSAFTKDGSRVFVSLRQRPVRPNPDAVKVDIWSYTDAKLQSQQLGELGVRELGDGRARTYRAIVRLNEPHRVLRLEQSHERPTFRGQSDDFTLFDERQGDAGDYNWATTGQPSYALVSTRTGERESIKLLSADLSPTGKYVVGYDVEQTNIFSYEVATGVTRNLTGSLPIPLVDRDVTLEPERQYRPLWIARWLPNDDAVLLYDRFDIWQIDPAGTKAPVNITNGYGRRHNIVFRFPGFGQGRNLGCPDSECRIVSAFNQTTKDDGYYRLASRSGADPELLTMGPYAYFARSSEPLPAPPVKARDADGYLVLRESATESPNYFWTRDFKVFTPVSDVHPEKDYSWPTAELVTFRTLNGHTVQGVLYKPGDFDPRKKYPVIIHYYEKKSDNLNQFRRPGRENGELDIAWFASHGYLVFTPDIYNTMGELGQDAMNSIIAAADYLGRFRWVDGTKMGLQGHSFGGHYTNYIITQSTRFAAAVASSGSANVIRAYGDLWGGGASKKEFVENRHYRMNASLWENPDLYIRNSPIFYADRVTTPLLMVANQRDRNVRFEHGVEFFTALRRLGKRVWMLQYDDGGHGVDGKDRVDYVIRMTQFFDHYLKGAPAAKWMTQGVPARLKGIETGLELDEPGKTPGPGLLLPGLVRAGAESHRPNR